MDAFSPWKKKTVAFISCQGISQFGTSVTSFSLFWYLTLRTHSGTLIALLTVCSFIPQMLISFASGVWADRHAKKKLIIAADGSIAFVTLLFIFAIPEVHSDSVLFALLFIVAGFRSLGTGIQTPAVNAVIPDIVPEKHLMRFNGFNAMVQSAVQFAAPAAAGAVLSFSGLRTALLIDVVTAVIGIGILSFIRLPGKRKIPEGDPRTSVSKALREGLRYAGKNAFIGLLLISYGLFIFLSCPVGFQSALYTSRMFGSTYWYLTAVEIVGFAGMSLGGLIIGAWGGFKKRMTTLLSGLAAFGLLSVGMGLADDFIIYLVQMLVLGIALTMIQTAVTTLIQERVDASMQGRVFGFENIIYCGSLSLGMIVFGPLADAFSMRVIMIGTGAAFLLLAFFIRLNKNMR